ncbi:MAG: hypothetical protein JNL36_01425 [Candidatus Kapabacteria bacterium]|nr:hypothetical protein [Candidatus Kapabacteria bacterium]
MKSILIFIIVVSTFSIAKSQWAMMKSDADSLIRVGTQNIYNVQFTQAAAHFKKVIEMYPDHPAGYFLDAMIDWWKMTLETNNKNAYDASFMKKIEKVIDVCDRILDKNEFDITGLFFKGGALGYRGRYYASREKWIPAANDGRVALDILIKTQKLAPNNHDILLGTGIYNYYAAALPEKEPVLKTVLYFLPSGDKVIGIKQLISASQNSRYAQTEAKVVLLQVYYQFEKNPQEALKVATDLNTKYPNNPYFHRYLGRINVQMGYMQQAEEVWKDILEKFKQKKYAYDTYTAREALYYIGLSMMWRGAYEDALQAYYKCDEASRKLDQDPSGFMVKTNLKIGNLCDILGKRDEAIKQYNKVLSWNSVQNSHDEARKYLKTPYQK